jgi:hypothetical protein
MGQTIWFRKANELYYKYRCAPSNEKAQALSDYKIHLAQAADTAKCTRADLHTAIIKRSGAYSLARESGKTEAEAFDLAAEYIPVYIRILEDPNGMPTFSDSN